MAVALTPVMARRYNHNPRGSATSTVVMKSNNPWERKSTLMNAPSSRLSGGALPGMSGLGDDIPTSNGTPIPTTGTSDLTAAIGAGVALATARISQLYGGGASALPILNSNAKPPLPPGAPAPSSSALPMLIGIGGIGVVVYLFLRKKPR
jgi:hypothetical protein